MFGRAILRANRRNPIDPGTSADFIMLTHGCAKMLPEDEERTKDLRRHGPGNGLPNPKPFPERSRRPKGGVQANGNSGRRAVRSLPFGSAQGTLSPFRKRTGGSETGKLFPARFLMAHGLGSRYGSRMRPPLAYRSSTSPQTIPASTSDTSTAAEPTSLARPESSWRS